MKDILHIDKSRGVYYIQHQPQVAGRTVDLTTDPSPDLVVEVDITQTDIDKNRLYASLGVPEFWRFNGQIWRIYQLQGSIYQEVKCSPTFPFVVNYCRFEDFAIYNLTSSRICGV